MTYVFGVVKQSNSVNAYLPAHWNALIAQCVKQQTQFLICNLCSVPACTLMRVPCTYGNRPTTHSAKTPLQRTPCSSRLASGTPRKLLQQPTGPATPRAVVPCAHMEGADDILTPEEGLNEEPGALTTRVSLQEVRHALGPRSIPCSMHLHATAAVGMPNSSCVMLKTCQRGTMGGVSHKEAADGQTNTYGAVCCSLAVQGYIPLQLLQQHSTVQLPQCIAHLSRRSHCTLTFNATYSTACFGCVACTGPQGGEESRLGAALCAERCAEPETASSGLLATAPLTRPALHA